MKHLVYGLMLTVPLSACGSSAEKQSSVTMAATESPATTAAETLTPPPSMLRFMDALVDQVVNLNPGSDTVSVKDLEAISVADLQPLALQSKADLGKIERLTDYLKPATRLKLVAYFNKKLASVAESSRAQSYSKTRILAGYQRFKAILALDSKTLKSHRTKLDTQDLNASFRLEAGCARCGSHDDPGASVPDALRDIIGEFFAIAFVLCVLLPAMVAVVLACAFLAPIVIPLVFLLELLEILSRLIMGH